MNVLMYIDGGSRGNPGPAAGGVVILDTDGVPLLEAGYWFGRKTNNQAEYGALLRGLEEALARGVTEIHIRSDSELLVRQLNGDYRVKSELIAPLFNQARTTLARFKRWKAEHVLRALNARADELANLAMDAAADVIESDWPKSSPSSNKPPKPAPAAKKPASGLSAPDSTGNVLVTCTRAPAPGSCPAHCRKNAAYVFNSTLPAGLCIEPARRLLDAVVARGAQDITCPKSDCGAVFAVAPEKNKN